MTRFGTPLVLGAAVLGLWAMATGAATGARAASPAEMRIDAPEAAQTVGTPFEVRVSITRTEAEWAGYADEMLYDPNVLKVNSVRPGGIADCKDPNTWANTPQYPGTILAACVFQSTTETGVIELIEFECIKDGSSALRFVTIDEDPNNGSRLFDFNAVNIPTDLVDASVTCGAGGPIRTLAAPTPPVAPSSVPPATQSDGGTPRATAVGSTQTPDDGGSGTAWWLIAVVIIIVLGAGGGAGWYVLQRRRGPGGG